VHEILSNPDTLELLTLSHEAEREYDPTVTTTLFHGYRVLGRAAITDERERYQLVEGFYRSSREGSGEMLCFMPHHALHAVRGGETVDLVICFHCLLYQLYYPTAGTEAFPETELSRFAMSFFMSAAADHGLAAEIDDEPEGNVTMGELRRRP
jgi:hypothetical protein